MQRSLGLIKSGDHRLTTDESDKTANLLAHTHTDHVERDKFSIKSNDVAGLRKFVLIEWNERDRLAARSHQ